MEKIQITSIIEPIPALQVSSAQVYNDCTPLARDANIESASNEVIVWGNFKGSNEVALSARIQRLEMRRRKLAFDEARAVRGRQKGDNGCESAEIFKTVGPESKNGPQLSVRLSKEDFRHDMQVIGQFNLGFIVARCRNHQIWILDQHACDEKYNYEELFRNTVVHEQKLLAPMPLELSAAEEACILDHMDVFEANGFRFAFDPEAPVRQRLKLTALPHSGAQDGRKAVQFNKDDVSALCAILSEGATYEGGDGGTGTDGSGQYGNNAVRRYASTTGSQHDSADRILARLPKAIAMFASRACRTSIMIGTALSQKEMEKVVQRLADVERPWNCPHGRPTMRHAGDILPFLLQDERNAIVEISDPTASVVPMTQEAPGTLEDELDH